MVVSNHVTGACITAPVLVDCLCHYDVGTDVTSVKAAKPGNF